MQTCQRAERKGTELTLHNHSKWHSLLKLHLASISQVLCPSHQSFNNRPPHMHLPFSKHLPLHFVDCLPDKITDSVEQRSHPSFSLTEKFHGVLTSPKFSDLWLRFPFLITSFSLVLIPQLQPVPAHLPSSNICRHLSFHDLVISWSSSLSGVLLPLHHKSLLWALQSFLLLFSKLSPIFLPIYCFESPEPHSVF